eukprot:3933330-Rhodomonas_salina.2
MPVASYSPATGTRALICDAISGADIGYAAIVQPLVSSLSTLPECASGRLRGNARSRRWYRQRRCKDTPYTSPCSHIGTDTACGTAYALATAWPALTKAGWLPGDADSDGSTPETLAVHVADDVSAGQWMQASSAIRLRARYAMSGTDTV